MTTATIVAIPQRVLPPVPQPPQLDLKADPVTLKILTQLDRLFDKTEKIMLKAADNMYIPEKEQPMNIVDFCGCVNFLYVRNLYFTKVKNRVSITPEVVECFMDRCRNVQALCKIVER
jgi:hypothetical protein